MSDEWSRRRWMTGTGALAAAGVWPRPARAEAHLVAVPHAALGAVVAAVGGAEVAITLDPELPVVSLRIGDATVSMEDRLLLKGDGDARRRYLDDARNAPKLGAAVREHLRTAWPELGDALTQRHRQWSRQLIRDVLRWTQTLGTAGLRDKRVRDPGGRTYLLEWAGATVARDGQPAPAGLAAAPTALQTPTPDAYRAYIQALVEATAR